MKINQSQELIRDAIREFIMRDRAALLLSANNHESTMSHRIALYLENLFKGYIVDCEYSRHLGDGKKIIRSHNGYEINIRPDIIIHKERNSDQDNLAIFEVKKCGCYSKLGQKDVHKIEDAIRSLNYHLGVYVGVLNIRTEVLWIFLDANGDIGYSYEIL